MIFKGLQLETKDTSVQELITDGASLASISKLGEALITTGTHSIGVPIFLFNVRVLGLSKNHLFLDPPSV